jgi:hypothetical protein
MTSSKKKAQKKPRPKSPPKPKARELSEDQLKQATGGHSIGGGSQGVPTQSLKRT